MDVQVYYKDWSLPITYMWIMLQCCSRGHGYVIKYTWINMKISILSLLQVGLNHLVQKPSPCAWKAWWVPPAIWAANMQYPNMTECIPATVPLQTRRRLSRKSKAERIWVVSFAHLPCWCTGPRHKLRAPWKANSPLLLFCQLPRHETRDISASRKMWVPREGGKSKSHFFSTDNLFRFYKSVPI